MTHYSRVSAIVIDVPSEDLGREAGFWSAASGETLTRYQRYPEYHGARLRAENIALLVQQIGEGDARVHIDIHTDDLEAEVARLERLGARRVRQVHRWWVMRDPAGLLFCVVPDPPGSLTDRNSRRWD